MVAELSAKHSADLVYISTGGVFDGIKGDYYTEDDTPNPIMVYGATKLGGEHEVRKIHPKSFIVRPGWMVGGGLRNDHKFVSFILKQLMSGARTINAVTDKSGTPTYTHDFALNLFALLDRKLYGTYHMVCKGRSTRLDVAKEIVRICGLDGEVEVHGVDSSFFAKEFWVRRPKLDDVAESGAGVAGYQSHAGLAHRAGGLSSPRLCKPDKEWQQGDLLSRGFCRFLARHTLRYALRF